VSDLAEAAIGAHGPLVIEDAEAMHALGRSLAAELRRGDLVLVSGPLGAGKTTLAQGVGAGLGVRGPVTSPTFVIARVHPSEHDGPAFVHVDAYRLSGGLDVDDLDLDTSLVDSVTLVEWGEGKVEALAEDRLEIEIERLPADETGIAGGDDVRVVHIRAVGPRWAGSALRLT
jgi:tRNA threonylcarbamoyladenosine biosynthesis protein TsaE